MQVTCQDLITDFTIITGEHVRQNRNNNEV